MIQHAAAWPAKRVELLFHTGGSAVARKGSRLQRYFNDVAMYRGTAPRNIRILPRASRACILACPGACTVVGGEDARKVQTPFRADHVGSLLRPPELLRAREDFSHGRITADDLRAIEDAAIRDVVRMQENAGLQA